MDVRGGCFGKVDLQQKVEVSALMNRPVELRWQQGATADF
jgi:hypothetical protein